MPQITCRFCGETKSGKNYYRNSRVGYSDCCKSCQSLDEPFSFGHAYWRENFSEEERTLFAVLRNLATKAKLRDREFDSEVDWKYLFDIWVEQNGLCAYSGVPLNTEVNHPHKVSLDRIDSSIGYVSGNLQFVSASVNRMKQEFDEEFFVDTCRQIAAYSKTTQ
jgi:hypothetical protein